MKSWHSGFVVVGLLLAAFTAGGPITVGQTRVDNAYPEQIAFTVDVTSTAAIARVELHLSVRGDTSTTVLVAAFEPGTHTSARAEWKTRRDGLPPGAPYTYVWRVWDEAGNTLTTPEEEGMTLDPRRAWSELSDERVGVWWYEGDAAFGQQIFDLASTALRQMEQESGQELPFRLHVLLYPDFEAFAEWHDYVLDWVGGEAYTAMGLTVQIIAPSDSWGWVQAVICHEVAHLFFFQATYHPISMAPHTWMSEGYAQVHECAAQPWLPEKIIAEARRQSTFIPLRLATGSFSGDDSRVSLLYAESWSAVSFLYDRWGEEGMAEMMATFREGADSNDALRAATGLDFEQFQEAWWEWLGGAPGDYPTPPSPATPGLLPTSATTATPNPTAAATVPPPGPTTAAWPCAGGAAGILGAVAAILPARRARRRMVQDR